MPKSKERVRTAPWPASHFDHQPHFFSPRGSPIPSTWLAVPRGVRSAWSAGGEGSGAGVLGDSGDEAIGEDRAGFLWGQSLPTLAEGKGDPVSQPPKNHPAPTSKEGGVRVVVSFLSQAPGEKCKARKRWAFAHPLPGPTATQSLRRKPSGKKSLLRTPPTHPPATWREGDRPTAFSPQLLRVPEMSEGEKAGR